METAMDPATVLRRLERATDEHNLDTLVDCFATDYVNDTPAHPARGFRGREQVRENWRQILAGVPDLRARVLRSVVDGGTVWSEWEMSGTRRDGSPHLMRGVILFGIADDCIVSARFYLEPVDTSGTDVNAAVRAVVEAAP
jgi:ketosteroid isomerase-like protein